MNAHSYLSGARSRRFGASWSAGAISARGRPSLERCLRFIAAMGSSSASPLFSPPGSHSWKACTDLFVSEAARLLPYLSCSHITALTRRFTTPRRGTPARPSCGALSRGWCAPAGCSCAAASSGTGEARNASTSSSAFSVMLTAFGQQSRSMPHATRCIARAVAASFAWKTGERMRLACLLSCRESASLVQSRMRCTSQRCQEAP